MLIFGRTHRATAYHHYLEHICLYRAPDGNVFAEQRQVNVSVFPHTVVTRLYRLRRGGDPLQAWPG